MVKITKKQYFDALLAVFFLVAVATLFVPKTWYRFGWNYTIGRFFQYSDAGRLEQFGKGAMMRLGLKEPPTAVRLLVLKEEKLIEVYGKFNSDARWRFLKQYPVIAASGGPGPKLREGDRQVPEGIYAIDSLHPNSAFYLALRVAYPSPEDISMARRDNRPEDSLGGNIMIHGKGGSVGCVALDDKDMEEVFTLAAHCGPAAIELLVAPYDFRSRPLPQTDTSNPTWLPERYKVLHVRMQETTR